MNFKVGDIVQAPGRGRWAAESEVYKIDSDYVYIRPVDGSTADSKGAFLPSNLVKVKDAKPKRSIRVYRAGSSEAYRKAREIAVSIAKRSGVVTIDEVQNRLSDVGFTAADLGNAAGMVFGGKNWIKVAKVRSVRAGNRGRKVSVWQYTGA